ncbi:hypothetical protein EVAR_10798_1 [Eumeta japonica]|uniref:Uncharacterized protein n=1 Tax=Eumeta variegata TaxID=151549 RepID=A0A4C1YAU3_EUMVA|nr:hypothetical protein EVAR_10798_1 [Eumeta japonica]
MGKRIDYDINRRRMRTPVAITVQNNIKVDTVGKGLLTAVPRRDFDSSTHAPIELAPVAKATHLTTKSPPTALPTVTSADSRLTVAHSIPIRKYELLFEVL